MKQLVYKREHNYRILETIYETENDASTFYKAFDEVEKRTVGIKSLSVNKKDINKAQGEAFVLHRFATKTKSIPALYHTYYDEQNERYYLIMQYIESGRTLEDLLKVPLSYRQAIQIMIQICDALIPFHKDNYQHRDLKPANIMVDHNQNQVYLIDFNLTISIPFKGEGTLHYRAPEQDVHMMGVGQDRVDMFSLGIIFYEMVTGYRPLLGQDYVPDRSGKEWRQFVKPSEKDEHVPKEICNLIMKCMELEAHKRPRDARDLKRLLFSIRGRIK